MSDNNKIVRNLRHMAWERAKGELRSMLHTFWADDDDKFESLKGEFEEFITRIEDSGLHE